MNKWKNISFITSGRPRGNKMLDSIEDKISSLKGDDMQTRSQKAQLESMRQQIIED